MKQKVLTYADLLAKVRTDITEITCVFKNNECKTEIQLENLIREIGADITNGPSGLDMLMCDVNYGNLAITLVKSNGRWIVSSLSSVEVWSDGQFENVEFPPQNMLQTFCNGHDLYYM